MADMFGIGVLSAASGAVVAEAVDAYLHEHPVTSGATEEEHIQIEQNTQRIADLEGRLTATDDGAGNVILGGV